MTRRTARRWLARAGLCLTLGLVTTVAVAWALAAWLPHENMWNAAEHVLVSRGEDRWIDTAEAGRPGMLRRHWIARTGFGPGRDLVLGKQRTDHVPKSGPLWAPRVTSDPWQTGARSWGVEDGRGWPMLALWCEYEMPPQMRWRARGGLLISGATQSDLFSPRALPMRPLWPGIVINTAAYALAWGAALVASGWMRRARRRAKGRCTGCGYDRAGLSQDMVCPECAAVPGRGA